MAADYALVNMLSVILTLLDAPAARCCANSAIPPSRALPGLLGLDTRIKQLSEHTHKA